MPTESSTESSQTAADEPPMDEVLATPALQGWAPLQTTARMRLAERRQKLSKGNISRSALAPVPGKSSAKTLVATAAQASRMKSLSARFDAQQQEEQKKKTLRLTLFSGMGGVTASILAHFILLAILAIVTLKLPSPPAAMSFESASAEAVEDAVELTQPMEASLSASDQQAAEPSENSVDFSDQLADMSSILTDSTGEMSSATSSLSNALSASSGGSGSSTAGASSASFYGAAVGGNNFCYVIDGSSSMKDGAWEAAKRELLRSLASLKPDQRFYIVFFNRELSVITMPGEKTPATRSVYATPENLAHARRWVDTLRIGIGAPPNKALALAIEKEPDAIYFLMDGESTVDVPEYLREINRYEDLLGESQIRVPIHAISFYSVKGQPLMRRIASENKGQFVFVPKPDGN